jgi:outer membrane murein-binding lipoprotein Lpp
MLGLRDERRRRRRQTRWTAFRWMLALGLIIAAGVFAYETGTRLAQSNVTSLEEQVRSLNDGVDALEVQIRAQAGQIASESARADEWHQRYQKEVPTGDMKHLFEAVQAKLAQGVTAERLRFVVEQTEKRHCDQQSQVKRVGVRTPLSAGAKTAASLANGTISLTLSGASSRDAAGNPSAWFDPSQPVTMRLARPGGKSLETAGTLPLRPLLVAGDREYRLSIVPGARGFAQVTVERCRFP